MKNQYLCNNIVLTILSTTNDTLEEWFFLCTKLWPNEKPINLHKSLVNILKNPQQEGFLIHTPEKLAIGFMNLSLRHDHVPGATKTPVAYIEGIYISEDYRQTGIGKYLVSIAEEWAIKKGCREIASDTLLNNLISQQFHTKSGFREVERTVNYLKSL